MRTYLQHSYIIKGTSKLSQITTTEHVIVVVIVRRQSIYKLSFCILLVRFRRDADEIIILKSL